MIKYEYGMYTLSKGEVQEVLSLLCKCGHKVSEHGSPLMLAPSGSDYDWWIPVSQCCLCDVCSKFTPQEKEEVDFEE